jgi:hypothetical protein
MVKSKACEMKYLLVVYFKVLYGHLLVPMATWSEAYAFIAWTLKSLVQIPLKVWIFVLIYLS